MLLAFFPGARARNSQEHIDSASGVVLAPEVQPGPHQIFGTVNGTDVFALFATPAEIRSHGGMLEQWG